ncbi:G-type lectin S-receptor-like serine/threonine-protein kinase At1g34300 [Cucurbita maxima]|uniref:Receptor-like serine/threonine-protein kinase n=1 Tax=Cucurbita maxima TaxID=3661 RepID=A0A6J1JUG9_CUCMA|nr:G-type lectin S-receptor-like serine/threonine-protein kinase At1g34300 [Cucurbita maxima]
MSLLLALSALFFLFFTSPSPAASQSPPNPRNFSAFSISQSPWRPTQNLLLLSPNSLFAAGFRQLPENSNLFLFSVWYFNISTDAVVWSANRLSPVNRSASLTITASGQLRLDNGSGRNLWPSNAVSANSNSTQLILRNDGDLIYATWESFQFPTNTILPNQTLNETTIVSNNGKYAFEKSVNLTFDKLMYWNSGNPFKDFENNGKINRDNQNPIYPNDYNTTRLRKLVVDDDGNLKIFSFNPIPRRWDVVWQAHVELCQIYGTCGSNSICMSSGSYNSTYCVCAPGFSPDPRGGARRGCRRKLNISKKVKFLQLDFVNFRGGVQQISLQTPNISVCEANCLKNSSCVGYTFTYDGSSQCGLQLDNLSNGLWSPGMKIAAFVKVDNSETDRSNFTGMMYKLQSTCPIRISLRPPPDNTDNTTRNIWIIVTIFIAELISGAVFFCAFLKRFIKYRDMARTLGLESLPAGGPKRFTYDELKTATNDFSNSVGKGGFGEVFKGELPDKRVIAVKCLKNITGGDGDFWSEVTIIARMHHLNLLRLWGFCAEKGQRMLVYEYIPNGSLDKFLFTKPPPSDSTDTDQETASLDWGIRYRIAIGVARAIAYLHEECLEWVLHRDIKPENILLDNDFCPKLSDFGLSKLRKNDETAVSMSRIRGTPGYVAPELVKLGSHSITTKADVYSFGMVLLEIISGTRNFDTKGLAVESAFWYFPSWAFEKAFVEEKIEEVLDSRIRNQYDSGAHFGIVNRMVQTAMWCLHNQPEMRPPMGKVVKMLEGKLEIPLPEKPSIYFLSEGQEGHKQPVPMGDVVQSVDSIDRTELDYSSTSQSL